MFESEIHLARGLRFLVTDTYGNINEHTSQGLYFKDTRHLSAYRLLIDNAVPELLTSRRTKFNSSTCVLTNPRTQNLPEHVISIIRNQTLEAGLHDAITFLNNGERNIQFTFELQFSTDFADVFEIKHLFLEKGNRPIRTRNITHNVYPDKRKIVFRYRRDNFKRVSSMHFDQEGAFEDWKARFTVHLKPKEQWVINVTTLFSETKDSPEILVIENEDFPAQEFDALHLIPPNLETDWHDLEHIYKKSLEDLAALRIQSNIFKNKPANLPAAGLPWFMSLFGRDSLITAYQTLMLGQDLAFGAISKLSQFQGKEINPSKEEEPGKILHEIRFGEVAYFQEWVKFPYYGTIDATPLFLILISEIYRWSGDIDFVNMYKENIKKALEWIDTYGDMDGDGFIEYQKKTPTGLDNQNWRDSWDSMAFNNGTEAEPPIASADVQGYVYDAKLRISELALQVWHDTKWSAKLVKEATELKQKFNTAFWIKDGEYFALGLDKNKKPINSISSSIGQLLWSGIVEKSKIPKIVNHLNSSILYSGWGVRTMGTNSKAYNPIGYHLGTIWPHDNSLIADGLKKAGYVTEATRIIKDLITASTFFDYRLPEVFAGYDRTSTPFPVQYPTSCSPQAWASGTAILFLEILLGIEPDYANGTLHIHPSLPKDVEYIKLDGVTAFGKFFLIEASQTDSKVTQVDSYTCYICKAKVSGYHKH